MKTAINLMVATLLAAMTSIMAGGDPFAHPLPFALLAGVLWGLIELAGGVPGVEIQRSADGDAGDDD